tara:strand:+ start:458 stop:886 length:429 start_codon:yes stop_codon:yes gene_type:complete
MNNGILAGIGFGGLVFFAISGCEDDLEVVEHNIDRSANHFELIRRVVFINTISDEYLLEVEGRCGVTNKDRKLLVTCEYGKNRFKQHELGLSRNVTYVVEQIGLEYANPYHYRVVFKPQVILPDIDIRGDLLENPLMDERGR